MRKTLRLLTGLLFIGSLFLSQAKANIQTDSINFEDQRLRVNSLLEERSKRFGEFDLSLEQKTGIFGIFKTKADMQRSIDILKQVVITDNNIFVETKKLLDIKDYERDKYASLAQSYDAQVTAHMKTVSKLQQENDKLRLEIENMDTDVAQNNTALYIALLIIVFLLFTIYQDYKRRKKKIDLTVMGGHKL